MGLEAIHSVVKVVGYVASAPGFGGQPQVVNGAMLQAGDGMTITQEDAVDLRRTTATEALLFDLL